MVNSHTTTDTIPPALALARLDVVDDYDRRGLDRLSDQALVDAAASLIGVPRAEIRGDRFSFVLHAPLELLARGALLGLLPPSARRAARLRIAMLVAGYEASGPPVVAPVEPAVSSRKDAAAALLDAIADEDLPAIDATAAWLGEHARPDEVARLLAESVAPQLSAAGHGNIYLALLARTQPRGLPGQMLRHPARALGLGSSRRLDVPPVRRAPLAGQDWVDDMLATLSEVAHVGPPPQFFIAPMVEHAQAQGVFDDLLAADGVFESPGEVPFGLLRFAAHAMLQGPTDHAPYGWTHCLTLAQAPLMLAAGNPEPARAVFVATAYLAAHWSVLGNGRVDLAHVPDPVGPGLVEALERGPAVAAAAAWHAPDGAATRSVLAESASRAHDAHRVKYTLACIDAAAADPAGESSYLAAAAWLNAWWIAHPDPTDPLAGQALDRPI